MVFWAHLRRRCKCTSPPHVTDWVCLQGSSCNGQRSGLVLLSSSFRCITPLNQLPFGQTALPQILIAPWLALHKRVTSSQNPLSMSDVTFWTAIYSGKSPAEILIKCHCYLWLPAASFTFRILGFRRVLTIPQNVAISKPRCPTKWPLFTQRGEVKTLIHSRRHSVKKQSQCFLFAPLF